MIFKKKSVFFSPERVIFQGKRGYFINHRGHRGRKEKLCYNSLCVLCKRLANLLGSLYIQSVVTEMTYQVNKTRLSSCREAGYSFDYQSNESDYVYDSSKEQETIEPFDNEKEALDFVNHYSKKVIDETR